MKKIVSLLIICFLSSGLFAAEEIDLYMALLEQDWLKAKSLLDNNSFLLNKQGEEDFQTSLGETVVESEGKTPLTFSVEYGLDLMIVRLLEYGADIEKTDYRGWTPLMVTAHKGNYNAARLILESGGKVNVFDKEGLSPLALAVGACRFDVADLLLDWHANLYGPIAGAFPLVEDIYRKKIELRDTLRILDTGAPGNRMYDVYPLFKGVEENNYSLVRNILLQGMFPDFTDSQGVTPLMKAVSLKTPYLTELLVEQGADVNHREMNGLSVLSVALYFGREQNVDILIRGGQRLIVETGSMSLPFTMR